MSDSRNSRRLLIGTVTSNAMAKTVTVEVMRAYRHQKYGKIVRRQTKYHAHDEGEVAQVGDQVEITATRPLSKLKRWRLSRVVVANTQVGGDTLATNPEAVIAAQAAEGKADEGASS